MEEKRLSVSATQQVVDRLNHRRSSKKWVVEEHIDIETVAEVHFLCKVYPFEVYKADLYTWSFVHNPHLFTILNKRPVTHVFRSAD